MMGKTNKVRSALTILGAIISAVSAVVYAQTSDSDNIDKYFGLLMALYVFGLLIIISAGIRRNAVGPIIFRTLIVGLLGFLAAVVIFAATFHL